MRHNTHDKTLYDVRKWIPDPRVGQTEGIPSSVADLNDFIRPTGRPSEVLFRQSGAEHALVPQPRGPKWKSRRVYGYIEQQVLQAAAGRQPV